jgi:ParB family chromosome partitioning protein
LQGGDDPIIKRGRKPSNDSDLRNVAQVGLQKNSADIVAESNSVDRHEIQRYIRLTHLLSEWLDKLDNEEVPVMAGYELSFLEAETQQEVYRYFFEADTNDKLTVKHAATIRAAFQTGTSVTAENIPSILHKPKNKRVAQTFTISGKIIKQYAIPKDANIESLFLEFLEKQFGKIETA